MSKAEKERNKFRKKIKKIKIDQKDEELKNLDTIFLDTVSKETRKENEQFLTPPKIAEFMVKWAINKSTGSFLDPAVGTGVFVQEAIKASKQLEVSAYDVDPLMLEAAKTRINNGLSGGLVKWKQKDFLKVEDEKKYDFIVCNPPYKKFKEYKNNHTLDSINNKYDIDINSQANLYIPFLIHSIEKLKENGRAAFITPNEFLYSNYGVEFKRYLVENTKLAYLIMLDFNVFEDILTTPVITLLENKKANRGHTEFIKTDKAPEGLSFLADSSNAGNNRVSINQKRIDGSAKWLPYFADKKIVKSDRMVEFNQLAKIKRGIATGFNDYFMLTKDDLNKWNISEKYFERAVVKSNYSKNYILKKEDLEKLEDEGKPTYLLYNVSEKGEDLKKYLQYGKEKEANERYLTSNRSPWYKVERRDPPQILATTFSRGDMRFIWNKAKARNLTAFHCVFTEFVNEKMVKAFLAFLNSGWFDSYLEIEKRLHGGLSKLEPNDLKKVEVIDITELEESKIKTLAKLFEELNKIRRKGNNEKGAKEKIDREVKKII